MPILVKIGKIWSFWRFCVKIGQFCRQNDGELIGFKIGQFCRQNDGELIGFKIGDFDPFWPYGDKFWGSFWSKSSFWKRVILVKKIPKICRRKAKMDQNRRFWKSVTLGDFGADLTPKSGILGTRQVLGLPAILGPGAPSLMPGLALGTKMAQNEPFWPSSSEKWVKIGHFSKWPFWPFWDRTWLGSGLVSNRGSWVTTGLKIWGSRRRPGLKGRGLWKFRSFENFKNFQNKFLKAGQNLGGSGGLWRLGFSKDRLRSHWSTLAYARADENHDSRKNANILRVGDFRNRTWFFENFEPRFFDFETRARD